MPDHDPHATRHHATRHQGILVLGVLIAAAVGWVAATSLAESVVRPDGLTRVLRGMVLIKGGMLAGAVILVFRRLGREVGRRSRWGYTVGMAVTGFAVGVLWSLSFIGLGSGLFYLGLLVALWAVSWDREMLRGWKGSEPSDVTRGAHALDDSVAEQADSPAHDDEPAQEEDGHGSFTGPHEPQGNGAHDQEDSRPRQTDHQRGHQGSDPVPAGVAPGALGEE